LNKGDLQKNRLLAALPADAFGFVEPELVPTTLERSQVVYEQLDCLTHVIFPHEGVVSLFTVMEDGRSAETATIGPEGYVGFTALLGERTAIQRYVVQVPGSASRLHLRVLDEAIARFPDARELLLRYSKALLAQTLQLSACNSLHRADQRCCRWLLMTHERVEGDTLTMKHEEIARLLGLRRSTVGATCNALQKAGVVRYTRGSITILDRQRLEASACECHRTIRRSYERFVPSATARPSGLLKRDVTS
jgi:CRP-like cAMP-binding protein